MDTTNWDTEIERLEIELGHLDQEANHNPRMDTADMIGLTQRQLDEAKAKKAEAPKTKFKAGDPVAFKNFGGSPLKGFVTRYADPTDALDMLRIKRGWNMLVQYGIEYDPTCSTGFWVSESAVTHIDDERVKALEETIIAQRRHIVYMQMMSETAADLAEMKAERDALKLKMVLEQIRQLCINPELPPSEIINAIEGLARTAL